MKVKVGVRDGRIVGIERRGRAKEREGWDAKSWVLLSHLSLGVRPPWIDTGRPSAPSNRSSRETRRDDLSTLNRQTTRSRREISNSQLVSASDEKKHTPPQNVAFHYLFYYAERQHKIWTPYNNIKHRRHGTNGKITTRKSFSKI